MDHDHLWHLADGTGAHAPFGELVVEEESGRLCCHLCGRWFASLGAHVRVHGYTAEAYREAAGLCTGEPLVSADLSSRIAARQALAYRQDPEVRLRLPAPSGDDRPSARRTPSAVEPPQRVTRRRAALAAGRETTAARRRRDRQDRLATLGYTEIADYVESAYDQGADLAQLARVTGLGRARLRAELDAASVVVRPSGHNTPEGRRSRARTAEAAAARRVGTDDLVAWLRDRRSDGWTLARLGSAVGHSGHWVRWRLDDAAQRGTRDVDATYVDATDGDTEDWGASRRSGSG